MNTSSLVLNPLSKIRAEHGLQGRVLRFHTRAPVRSRGLQECEVYPDRDPHLFELLNRLVTAQRERDSEGLALGPEDIDRLVDIGLLVERTAVPRRVELPAQDDPDLAPLLLCEDDDRRAPCVVLGPDGWRAMPVVPPPSDVLERFRAAGYLVLPPILGGIDLARVRGYVRRMVDEGFLSLGDPQGVRYVAHNEPLVSGLHRALTDLVSTFVGTRVQPSYCYLATYLAGSSLDEHTDRPQCEYSITLQLDNEPTLTKEASWPIWLRDDAGVAVPIRLGLGEGLLYRGCERPHFRAPLDVAKRSTSVFLHYVDIDFDDTLD